jgi:2-oxoglutarate ferredoxin oxidoreductase subunit delta
MAKIKGTIVIDKEQCKGCEVCTVSCQFKCIGMSKEVNGKGYRYAVLINDDCTGCTNCAVVCPDGVISVYRAKVE